MRTTRSRALAALALALAACEGPEAGKDGGQVFVAPHPGHGGSGGDGAAAPSTPTEPAGPPPGSGAPPWGPEGPWPRKDVVHLGAGEGLPGRVTGVGVDDGQNVYAIDGEAIYALRPGDDAFVRTASGGQLDLGWPAHAVVGGAAGRVYVGYLAAEGSPEELTEEDKLAGDVDRWALRPDGTLALEFHHRLQNSKARWMDHTRMILSLSRVVAGPGRGDVYAGSNHGVTLIRGDQYADHRHVTFLDEAGSQAVGYVWATNVDRSGNLLFGGHWKLGALGPAPATLLDWLDHAVHPWKFDSWAENLGPVEDPDEIQAIAGDLGAGRIFVGTRAKGLSAAQVQPRRWWKVEGGPGGAITSLELDADGKLWVGTSGEGLWRYDEAADDWEKSPHVPPEATVHQVLLDDTVTPRAVYVATGAGLHVIRAP